MFFRFCLCILIHVMLCLPLAAATAAPTDDAQITGVRWGRNGDALTGNVQLRLVLETNGPVEVDHFVTQKPNWRLVVSVRGSSVGKAVVPPSPDKTVVDKMSLLKSGNDTHVILDLPGEIKEEQYKIFTLKADPVAKRPFRVVVDIEKGVALPDFKFTQGLRGKVIAIDPGHGGTDPGAIGRMGTREKALNLSLGLQVKAMLEKAGAQVVMTRTTDVDVSSPDASDRDELRARTMIANNRRADVFVSIHHNSSPNGDLTGTSTYYYRKTLFDAMLAQSLQDAMLQTGGLDNQGVRTANFYVIKNTLMPAALVEVGYMSNPQEELACGSPQFQSKIAQAIVMGLDNFFTQAMKMRGGR